MTLHNEFKTWLKDLGLNSDFKFYNSAYEEIEMLGSQEVATENEYYDLDISKKQNKNRLSKLVLSILYLSEVEDDPYTALNWMIELFDYWFNQGGDLDLSDKHLSEFVNLTTFLCKQDGTFLSCHSDDNGYECVNQISAFIHSYFGKRDEFPTKIIRNNNCEIVFDTYGDKNVTLCLFGGIIKYMELDKEKLPSVDFLAKEMRQCSDQNLKYLSEEDIFEPFEEDIKPGFTIFDEEFWEQTPKAKFLLEKAITKIIKENDPDYKSNFNFKKINKSIS